MLDDARTLLAEEGMEEEEQLKFIEELTAELEGKELQERGATLVDILELDVVEHRGAAPLAGGENCGKRFAPAHQVQSP